MTPETVEQTVDQAKDQAGAVPFQEDAAPETPGRAAFVLRLASYEGPIDLLLDQARAQKVDLTEISILDLAEQYLTFVEQARRLRLELAADYLVMAAWLAYLKSRLLLPEEEETEQPTAGEMAEALAFQLRRLDAMRTAAERLMQRPRRGIAVFARGAPEPTPVVRTAVFDASVYDLLSAYAEHKRRTISATARLRIEASRLYSMDDALERLVSLIGGVRDWTALTRFLPASAEDPLVTRSAVAATFAAALELARSGKVLLRQDRPLDDLYLKPTKEKG